MNVTPTIAIIGAGAMGSMLARRAARHGCRVLTPLAGRTPATVERARRAGMTAAALDEVLACPYILSIVPPAQARQVAEELAAALQGSGLEPSFVDCNALDPDTVAEIAAIVAAAGARCIDAGIIGGPGTPDGPGPRFYLGGERPQDMTFLRACGIHVITTGGAVGAASALKMAYAGINKGLIGLSAAMILAATRAGAGQALHSELAYSQSQLLQRLEHALPDMFPKAYRWDFEMQEVASFGGDVAGVQQIFQGMSRLYAQLAADWEGDRAAVSAIQDFLQHELRAAGQGPRG
jgi:3-hydroxyisobutyrate dehydrogenase-like beta-hydroxyacid dehydrogenase